MTVTLYEHEPRSLLPLLRTHLPYSIGIVGTILSNPSSHLDPPPEPDTPRPEPLTVIYASFPPTLVDPLVPDSSWLVALALPQPSEQIRVYHSLEGVPEEARTSNDLCAAQMMVDAAVREMAVRYPTQLKVGQLHVMWAEGLRQNVVGGIDRGGNTTFLSPESDNMFDLTGVDDDGLYLDHGRSGDEVMMYATNKYRPESYYASRLGYATVLRTRPAEGTTKIPPAVAWIMTHADGSQGALYTIPEYRRRGLAKRITSVRLDKCMASGVRGYVNVEVTNVASQRMWEGLGWEKAWEVTWVYK